MKNSSESWGNLFFSFYEQAISTENLLVVSIKMVLGSIFYSKRKTFRSLFSTRAEISADFLVFLDERRKRIGFNHVFFQRYDNWASFLFTCRVKQNCFNNNEKQFSCLVHPHSSHKDIKNFHLTDRTAKVFFPVVVLPQRLIRPVIGIIVCFQSD